jgi:phenylacetate-CoA ligase
MFPAKVKMHDVLRRLYWTWHLGCHYLKQVHYPFRSRDAVRHDQSRRIQRMVAHAYRFVPYYRETFDRLGLRPSDFRTVDDLARLPVLERREIQSAPERFLSSARSAGPHECFHTGGSTGAPISIYHGLDAILQTAVHGQRYHDVFAAHFPARRRSRETWIFPSADSNTMRYRRLQLDNTFLAERLVSSRQFLSMLDPPEKNIPLINAHKPDVIHSYGSYLEVLFARLQATGEAFHRPKAVGFGGDGLSDSARRLILDHFGIPAFSLYSSVEAPSMAFECGEHRGLHINEDIYPLRVVDASGRSLPAGEYGEVVVSNLVNRTMILLNYRLGDLAALLPDPCACGRSLPLMSFPAGRKDDWLELPSGEPVHPSLVYPLLRDEEAVLQYRVVQESPLDFHVVLVAKTSCNRLETEARLAAKFGRVFGGKIRLRVSFVSFIPRTPSGKVRPVMSMRHDP